MYAYSRLDFFAIRDDLQKLAIARSLGQHHRKYFRRQYAIVLRPAIVRVTERRYAFE